MVSIHVYLLAGLVIGCAVGVLAMILMLCLEAQSKRQITHLKSQLVERNLQLQTAERSAGGSQNELGLLETKCNEARAEAEVLRAERSRAQTRIQELSEAAQQHSQALGKARERGDRIRVRVLKAASEIRDVVTRTEADLKGEV